MFNSLIFFVFILSFDLFGQTVPDYCENQSIYDVSIPVVHGEASLNNNVKLTYRYRFTNKLMRYSLPTFVLLPGGPGGKGIFNFDDDKMAELYGIPKGYPTIMVDPRGVGCNYYDFSNLPAHSLTTRNMSLDVLAILRKEKLKNYVVVGGSFGTIWATQLVHYIQKAGLTEPKKVVLGGVLGRAHKNYENRMQDRIKVYEKLFKKLSYNAQIALSTKDPMGIKNVYIIQTSCMMYVI